MQSVNSSNSTPSVIPSDNVLTDKSAVEIGGATRTTPAIGTNDSKLGRTSVDPPRVLMVATDFATPYRVLRCAQASGAEVYVLGNAGARALRFSRYCQRVVISDCVIHGARDEELALEINCLVRELGITLVMPADAPSVRAILTSRDLIEAPCFPLPSLEQFDILNNKWAFATLCRELGIRHPSTYLLPDAAALAREIATGAVEYPLIIKPLDHCAGEGVIVLDGVDSERRLNGINYKPVLVQKFISGQDIGASVYAKAGKIEAFIAHWLRDGIYATFQDDQIYSDLEKIVSRFDLEGVYNFDMILAPDRSVYYLECNPRFFYKINLSMIAGINFVERGIPGIKPRGTGSIQSGVQVRFPKALLRSLVSSVRCTNRDWALAGYLLSDPWPFLMEKLNLTV